MYVKLSNKEVIKRLIDFGVKRPIMRSISLWFYVVLSIIMSISVGFIIIKYNYNTMAMQQE